MSGKVCSAVVGWWPCAQRLVLPRWLWPRDGDAVLTGLHPAVRCAYCIIGGAVRRGCERDLDVGITGWVDREVDRPVDAL